MSAFGWFLVIWLGVLPLAAIGLARLEERIPRLQEFIAWAFGAFMFYGACLTHNLVGVAEAMADPDSEYGDFLRRQAQAEAEYQQKADAELERDFGVRSRRP